MSRLARMRVSQFSSPACGGGQGGGAPSSRTFARFAWILLALAAACAHAPRSSDRLMVFPPVVIVAGDAQDRELALLNPNELLAKGRAAYAAQDYATAAKCFSRGA